MTNSVILLSFLLAAEAVIAHPLRTTMTVNELARRYATQHPNTKGISVEECQVYTTDSLKGPAEIDDPLNAVVDKNLLWPQNTLYYTIFESGYTAEQIAQIEEAIRDLQDLTSIDGQPCVTLQHKTTEVQTDYVFVDNYSGCSSYVGRVGGPQRMSLVDSCVAANGTIMHEFLHALGFYHEHSRTDRDDYVTVNWDNIEQGYYSNFVKLDETQIDLLGTGYDYGSVMHYNAYAFAVDPSVPTIVPLNESAEIGQRVSLSPLDVERVQILYNCLKPAESVYFRHLATRT